MSNFDWDNEYPSDEEIEQQLQKVSAEQAPVIEEPRHTPKRYEPVQQNEEEILEEELDDMEFLTNARLRLEQGRLYEMLLKHNLFADVDSDPRAIANVQRELKNYIQERLEVLLGLRPDPRLVKMQVEQNLPFNSLEINLLKSVVSKMSSGATERFEPKPSRTVSDTIKPLSLPKTDSIKPISGNKPVAKQPPTENVREEIKKAVAPKKQPPQASATVRKYERPNKPLSEWTDEERVAHNKHLSEEQAARKAHSAKAMPMPSYEQQYLQYGLQASKGPSGDSQMSKLIQRFTSGD